MTPVQKHSPRHSWAQTLRTTFQRIANTATLRESLTSELWATHQSVRIHLCKALCKHLSLFEPAVELTKWSAFWHYQIHNDIIDNIYFCYTRIIRRDGVGVMGEITKSVLKLVGGWFKSAICKKFSFFSNLFLCYPFSFSNTLIIFLHIYIKKIRALTL